MIEPGALEEALSDGRPGSPRWTSTKTSPCWPATIRCCACPTLLCTPHTAWLEQATYELYFGEAFENAAAFAEGRPVNLVNT